MSLQLHMFPPPPPPPHLRTTVLKDPVYNPDHVYNVWELIPVNQEPLCVCVCVCVCVLGGGGQRFYGKFTFYNRIILNMITQRFVSASDIAVISS